MTPVFRAAIATIENLFDPETIILGGLAAETLLAELASTTVSDLPNSVSARRDRQVPRLLLSDGGPLTVLRGAAALVVSGVLSPRAGQTIPADTDPLRFLAA